MMIKIIGFQEGILHLNRKKVIKLFLSDSNHELAALFNNAAIGIIIANGKGEIIQINQFALKQFGYKKDELLGQKIEVLIPKRYESKHIKHREQYGRNAHSRPMGTGIDLFAVKKSGIEFPVEVSLSPYDRDGERFAIAFVSDISVRKESENALLKLNAELEEKVQERTQSLSDALEKEKELNELKSRFVSMASHEFRTPLSTILSSAYLVSKYVTGEDQLKRDKHIQRIVSSVNMLTDILNDFLSVGKIEEGKIQVRFSEFNLKEFMYHLGAELHPIFKKDQKIEYSHTGPESVFLDQALLKHIVMNLVSNAIKFSPENASIDIKTDIGRDGTISLKVKDAGIGIPEEDQEHLFERFFRAGNVVNIQGTGLGLHIVSKYVELMNGEIMCNSKLGVGTEFLITFKKLTHS
jgi:PAS domain S-box-containing protein